MHGEVAEEDLADGPLVVLANNSIVKVVFGRLFKAPVTVIADAVVCTVAMTGAAWF